MKKIFMFLAALLSITTVLAADELWLSGRVKDAVTKIDLTAAQVLLYDSTGAVTDTLPCNKGLSFRNGELDTLANYYIKVPRVDSTYVFDIVCPGYQDQTVTFTVSNIGRREQTRDVPMTFMKRAPNQLKEVTVTSTKIKFYNKGDTLVFNADAFQLAEGSMLDALIAQLPGVELNTDGQIKVNGEFVESLLLNGKPFIDGNNNLMLENIGAYTVKNIQVYEGLDRQSKMAGDSRKQLTMDVRLKKEYNMGWIINAQAGYGSADRYTGRLFANWFNATTRVTLAANANNLNDNRTPGRNDTWTPEMMPSGKKEFRTTNIDYDYESTDERNYAGGGVRFAQTVNNYINNTSRTNFLPGADTYNYSEGENHRRETELYTQHYFDIQPSAVSFGASLTGKYTHNKNVGSDISGAFTSEQQGISGEILDALYSDGSDERLAAVINRAKTRSDGWHRTLSGSFSPTFNYNIPRTDDRLFWGVGVNYSSDKEELWRDYMINYGSDPVPAIHRRQYIDNSPNHNMGLNTYAGYSCHLGNNYINLRYKYSFNDLIKDLYMYALERLEDMGVYGVVPAEYLAAFDPANSFTSRTLTNTHAAQLMVSGGESFSDLWLSYMFRGELDFTHRNFNYWRNGVDYKLSTQNTTLDIPTIWDGRIELYFNKSTNEGGRPSFRNHIRYSCRITPQLPELADMVDVVNDADPLNIYLGNPDLRTQMAHKHLVRWQYTPFSHSLTNVLYLGYNHTSNALTRGYTYDTATGIRANRMYNVSGNNSAAVTNELKWQFGSKRQFTLSSSTDASLAHYTDMIGVDLDAPALTKVKNRSLSENLRLSWDIAGQLITLRGDWTNRHTTSSQPGFSTLNATHFNYGISAVFKLPAGFGASTDFMCYTRRGYGVASLDTTDPIWNARLTYCPPRHSRWVFMVDGFDLLHKLSNVNYAVTASGRTVSYTNTLPRYVMMSVQYRLTIQPKK